MKVHDLPCVYVLDAVGSMFFKVGRTDNFKNRFNNIQTGCPFNLALLCLARTTDPYSLESYMHGVLAKHRHRGEWFILDEKLKFWAIEFCEEQNRKTRLEIMGVECAVV